MGRIVEIGANTDFAELEMNNLFDRIELLLEFNGFVGGIPVSIDQAREDTITWLQQRYIVRCVEFR